MLAGTQLKEAALRTVSTTQAVEPRKPTGSGNMTLQWSRSSRYTLRIPITAREITISSRRILRQVDAMLFLPSNSYRSFNELEQEVCNSVFGTLYQQGERTDFAMYAEVEMLCQLRTSQDSQADNLSPNRRKFVLDEDNWDEVLGMVLCGEATSVELRANWWKSKKPGQVPRNVLTSQTPANFPVRKSMDQISVALSSPDKGKSISPKRSEMGSRRSSGTVRNEHPRGRVDSGQQMIPTKQMEG